MPANTDTGTAQNDIYWYCACRQILILLLHKLTNTSTSDNYNTDTGVFTVPLGGIYLFTVQLCIDQSKYIDTGLVVDGVYMDISRYQDNYGSVCCFKLTTTVSLKSGNKVWVKVIYTVTQGIGHHSPEFLFIQIN
jgi:hypothetical protein